MCTFLHVTWHGLSVLPLYLQCQEGFWEITRSSQLHAALPLNSVDISASHLWCLQFSFPLGLNHFCKFHKPDGYEIFRCRLGQNFSFLIQIKGKDSPGSAEGNTGRGQHRRAGVKLGLLKWAWEMNRVKEPWVNQRTVVQIEFTGLARFVEIYFWVLCATTCD